MKEIKIKRCNCESLTTDYTLKKRVTANGTIQYAAQCNVCGRQVSENIGHKLLTDSEKKNAEAYDSTIATRYWKKYGAERTEKNKQKFDLEKQKYYKYLESAEWKEKSRLTLKRDGYTCQMCGVMASQAHHLTYARIYNERQEDLISVCQCCHNLIHDNDMRSQTLIWPEVRPVTFRDKT